VALVAVAVALAFADASVVVLALPEIYGTFAVSIVDAAWVITSYNVAVAGMAILLLWVPVAPRRLATAGLLVFAASSVVCGTTTSFGVLVAGRVVQGVGAALLLAGALPLLAVLWGSTRRARVTWVFAAAVGVAIGPALGGLLTQALSWRSIFLVQGPVAVVALAGVALARGPVPTPSPGPERPGQSGSDRGLGVRAVLADLGFVLLFAALVGALFLSVLLLVVVWRYSPLEGALVVSALAVGTVAVGPVERALPRGLAALSGGWMLTGGLVGLAWLPATAAGYALVALGFCGVGFGLLNGVLTRSALPETGEVRRAATLEVGAKHLGIVVGLIAIAPLLAGDLEEATQEAAVAATAVVLDAPLSLRVKVPLALDLKDVVEKTPRGEVPDVREPFERRGADDDANVAAVRDGLTDAIEAAITRSFRPAFTIAAFFAAAAMVVGTLASLGRRVAAAA
jgi:MFS family permease